jgi:hypothetical protein
MLPKPSSSLLSVKAMLVEAAVVCLRGGTIMKRRTGAVALLCDAMPSSGSGRLDDLSC